MRQLEEVKYKEDKVPQKLFYVNGKVLVIRFWFFRLAVSISFTIGVIIGALHEK